jgi:ankyrin repeat protein
MTSPVKDSRRMKRFFIKLAVVTVIFTVLLFLVSLAACFYGNPLSLAVMTGNKFIVSIALKHYKDKINSHSNIGDMVPIHHAADGKSVEVAKLLLDNGADVNDRESDAGLTALHYAVSRRNLPMVELLLHYGASPVAVDNSGQTPIDMAGEMDDCVMLPVLIKYRKKIAASDGKKPSPAVSYDILTVFWNEPLVGYINEASKKQLKFTFEKYFIFWR